MMFPPYLTRRSFLQQSSALALLHAAGSSRYTSPYGYRRTGYPYASTSHGVTIPLDPTLIDPSVVQRFALRALDAARSAGANYADVRLTRTLLQNNNVGGPSFASDSEALGIGVRALVNGAWGFAASSSWMDDDVVRVAQLAVAQARVNAQVNAAGGIPSVELVPVPVATGNWIMPVREDPFRIPWEVKLDVIQEITERSRQLLPRRSTAGGPVLIPALLQVVCWRQECALATTDGTYVTQTVYRTGGELSLQVLDPHGQHAEASAAGLDFSGYGWEVFTDAKLPDQIPTMVEAAEADLALPVKPIDVGQYDVVCDAVAMAGFVDATIGHATELDRAVGMEANASGTSYLGPDPLTWLGQDVASPLVNVTANRSLNGGLATVKWDAEGTVPRNLPLITAGRLVDYQTTRDLAPLLAPWYTKHGKLVQSSGCGNAEDAQMTQLSMTPNLTLEPQTPGPSFDSLQSNIRKGFAFVGGLTQTDFQAKTGTIQGKVYEITNGRRSAKVWHAAILFTATDLWKKVTALGGPDSAKNSAHREDKGEPQQTAWHTVRAVPALLQQVSIIDITREA